MLNSSTCTYAFKSFWHFDIVDTIVNMLYYECGLVLCTFHSLCLYLFAADCVCVSVFSSTPPCCTLLSCDIIQQCSLCITSITFSYLQYARFLSLLFGSFFSAVFFMRCAIGVALLLLSSRFAWSLPHGIIIIIHFMLSHVVW